VASHASTSKSALSPARARISSTSQRARPTPGTCKGEEGSTEMRQRVTAAVTKTFLEAAEDRLIVAGLQVDHPIRPEARLRQCRCKQVRPGDAPQHLTLKASRDSRCEQSRRGTVYGPVATASHLVKSSD
jgi:hypothetical protein